jgi:hypothetical protein
MVIPVSIHFSPLAIPLIGARTTEHLSVALGGTTNAKRRTLNASLPTDN